MIVKALGAGALYTYMEITDDIDEDGEIGFTILDSTFNNLLSIWLTSGPLEDIYNHLGKLLEKRGE